MKTKVTVHARIFNNIYLPYLNDYSRRWNFYFGSAGSGKSVFVVQKLILKALKDVRRCLVVRRHGTELRHSVYQLFRETLLAFGMADQCRIVESMLYIELPNGSEFIFMGADDEAKLLSIQNISDVFVEEATELNKDFLQQLSLRMRGTAPNPQLYLAFNPVSKTNFMYEFMEINPPADHFKLKTTYKDNRFLKPEYIAELEDLRRTNPRKAKVYCDGEWGTTGKLVFEKWDVKEFDTRTLLKSGTVIPRFGGDFGFTLDPTTLVATLYNRQEETIYVFDELYQRGMSNLDIVNELKRRKYMRQLIYFDSAEPKSIHEMNRLGATIKGASKGKDSIKYGISFLQRHKIIIHPKCENVLLEIKDYQYKYDKQTGTYDMEKFDGTDHAIDGLRYAYSEYYNSTKFKTLSKSKLGL